MKLLGFNVDVAGQNIIQDDVLDEGALIVLLVVEALDIAERNCKNLSGLLRFLVVTLNEYDTFVLVSGGNELVGVAVNDNGVAGEGELLLNALSGLTDLVELAASYYDAVFIYRADGTSYNILHLMNYRLEQAV